MFSIAISSSVYDTVDVQQVRVIRSARKHRIGNAHILAAMINAGEPTVEGDTLVYVGTDDRGVELRIVAVPNDKGDGLAVIHCMPTGY
jgi:hypothetical protein